MILSITSPVKSRVFVYFLQVFPLFRRYVLNAPVYDDIDFSESYDIIILDTKAA